MQAICPRVLGSSLARPGRSGIKGKRPRFLVHYYSHFMPSHFRLNSRKLTTDNHNRIKHELAQGIMSSCSKIAWGSSDLSENDFRSISICNLLATISNRTNLGDVITRPSINMLESMINTTLGDDVFREDETTIGFEQEVAELLGHEAGCFVVTGTMANQIALRALLHQPPYAILCDAKAHIINYEAAGPAFMCGAMVQAVAPRNGRYLTIEDIKSHAVTTHDVHKCPTKVISLENTCAGMIISLDDIARISEWTREHNLKIHLDGARLWEAVAAGAGSLREYGRLVDCVTVDFSKGLGAPMGAMILGNVEMVHQIRRIRKGIGGGLRQAGVLASAAQAALKENFGDQEAVHPRLQNVHRMAKEVGQMWTSRGGQLIHDVETNQVWVDLDEISVQPEEFNKIGIQHDIRLNGQRIVLHYQISRTALSRLESVFEKCLEHKRPLSSSESH